MLERLAEFLLDPGVSPLLIYAIVFVSCILESFFPPWPTDVIAIYAGFLAGRGVLTAEVVFLAAIIGTQVGVMAVFFLSRHWGRALLAGPLGRYVPLERLARLEVWFARYGAPAIAISRFLPAVRALVMPAAGLAGFPAWKVWVFAGVSVVLWNVSVVGVGLLAGTHLPWAKQVLVRYNVVAGVLVSVVVLVLLVRFSRRWYLRRGSAPPA